MASMDLKTGNKVEGARPGPPFVSMPTGWWKQVRVCATGLLGSLGPWGWFSWTAISLASLVCVSKRVRRREGGPLRDYFRTVDGSHASLAPEADMSGRAPTSSPKAVDDRYEIAKHAQPRVMRLVYGGCKSTKTFARRGIPSVPPGSYSETWAALRAPLLGGLLPGEAKNPRVRCIANPRPFAHLPARSGVSQASATPSLHAPSCHTMCCITTAVRGGDPGQRCAPAVRAVGSCGGRKRKIQTTALISHDSEPGPAPVRENRIQFPTHRPDVQDAQCCAQVGRSVS